MYILLITNNIILFTSLIYFYNSKIITKRLTNTTNTTMEKKIVDPNTKDVLCGRGNYSMRWKGNVYYRKWVNRYRQQYLNGDEDNKKKIAQTILDKIGSLSPPGRFLKLDKNGWFEIGKSQALRKTRQALREGAKNFTCKNAGKKKYPMLPAASEPKQKKSKSRNSSNAKENLIKKDTHESCITQGNQEANDSQISNIKIQSNSSFSSALGNHFEQKKINAANKPNNHCQEEYGNEIRNIERQQIACFASSLDEDLSWFALDEKFDLSEFNPRDVFSNDST